MRSIYDNVTIKPSVGPVSRSSLDASAVPGTVVDTKGFNTGMIVLIRNSAGASSIAEYATSVATLYEGAKSDGSDMAIALDNRGSAIAAQVTTTDSQTVGLARIEGLGTTRKRYLQIRESSSWSGSNSRARVVVAEIALGRAFSNPANTTASNT